MRLDKKNDEKNSRISKAENFMEVILLQDLNFFFFGKLYVVKHNCVT